MTPSDLPQVNQVLSLAFTYARREEGYKDYRVPPCRDAFLQMYLAQFLDGNYVIEDKHRVIGFVFSHMWGTVGWLGPLAVTPQRQGEGLGRQLVEAAVKALKQAGAETIGLETMPRNYRNLRFYARHHFHPTFLTVDMVRPIDRRHFEGLPPGYEVLQFSKLSHSQQANFSYLADALATQVDPHLMIANEVELANFYQFGDGFLLMRHGRSVAFAVAHTEKYYHEEPRKYLKVYLAGLEPESPSAHLPAFFTMLENWALQCHLSALMLRMSTRHQQIFHRLVQNDFHPIHSDVRFVLNGYEEKAPSENFYINKWE